MARPDTKPGWRMLPRRPQGRLIALDTPQQVEAPWMEWTWQAHAMHHPNGWPILRYYNTITGEEYWEAGEGRGPVGEMRVPVQITNVGEEMADASTGLPPVVGGKIPNERLARQAELGRSRRQLQPTSMAGCWGRSA